MKQHAWCKMGLVAGLDEAGRGCLAGPVVAAAVILPRNCRLGGLNDSKKLTEEKRNQLRENIEKKALAWSVSFVDQKEIDHINILNASILAMHRSVDALEKKPDFLLIDGNRFHPYSGIEHQTVVKGDAKFRSIAAASILAKTYRDEYMESLHLLYPEYGWNKNKAYPTRQHVEAMELFGLTIHHRESYQPCKALLKKGIRAGVKTMF